MKEKNKVMCFVLLIGITFLLLTTVVSAKTLKDHPEEITLEVDFDEIVSCQDYPDRQIVMKIGVENEKYVTYTIYCDEDLVYAEYSNDVMDYDSGKDDTTFDQGDEDKTDLEIEFDIDIDTDDFCQEYDYGIWDEMRGNLSFCYNTMQTLVSLEEQCIDNSELKGEYMARWESCDSDYFECSESLTEISDERDSFDEEVSNCDSELVTCNGDLDRCKTDKSTCIKERDDYEKKAGKVLLYCIICLGVGGLIVHLYYSKQRRGPSGYEKESFDYE